MKYVIVIAMVGLLMLAACSSGGTQTTSSGSQQGNDIAAANNADAGNADASGGSAGGSALDKLKSAMGGKFKYTADYEITTPDGPKVTQTMSFDSPKVAMKMSQQGTQSWIIYDGSKAIACTKASGDWMCLLAGEDLAPQEPSEDVIASLDENPDVQLAGACTRAGETGVKYKVTVPEGSSEYCVTTDGILLESTTTAQGKKTSMVATRVSRSVSASDFTPPATPVDMAAYQQQMMAGQGLPAGFEMPE
jgi:hypothetical protein